MPNTTSDLTSYSKEEIEEINSHLLEFKKIDESLWKYNLRDNVVQSIVKSINDNQYTDYTISNLLKKAVIPTLQKLGLEDRIPQLQEELSTAKGQSKPFNNKSWELSPTQKIEVQISQKRAANGASTRDSVTNNQDIEYSK